MLIMQRPCGQYGRGISSAMSETGWDLGPFAAVLQCLHPDTTLLKPQNTKKLYGTKNNCVHAQLGQILDPKDTKRPKNPTAAFEEPVAKPGRQEQKQGTAHAPLHTPPPEG